MSALITLESVAASTPDGRALFDNLTLAFGRERTGLVGRNGVGKTSLLRLLAGETTPVSGTVAVSASVGVLAQSAPPAPGETAADRLGVGQALAVLARIEAGEGSPDSLAEDLAVADWTLPNRIDEALAEVGLVADPAALLARPASAFSGGQLTRLALAALLVAAPDMVLLDEPTNHLDAEGRVAVARFLDRWRGGAVVVSHDRDLLRGMDRIVELSSLGARVYGGGYDLYAERKAQERAAAETDLAVAERDASRVDRDVQQARERKARRDGAGKRYAESGSAPKILLDAQAERAQKSAGRGERLAERQREAAGQALEEAAARVERVRPLAFSLPSTGLPAGRLALAFENVFFAWPDGTPVLTDLSLRIVGPERLAITGPNGGGKTTLIRLAAGELEPTSGVVRRGVRAVRLDQHAALLEADQSILENFQRLNPEASVNAAQAALARFLFRNTAARQRAGSLSGGERLRAAMACVLSGAEPPQLLILDEPTNHLDLDSVQAVEAALAGYDGALLVVSHDADFLEGIGVTGSLRSG